MAEFVFQMIKARKSYGDRVILDDVTLSFLPGAKIGVVGPNGMGKSTLLKIMAGLETVSNGEASLTPGFTVGILQQEPPLDDDKTVIENVRMAFGDMIAKVDRFNKIGEEMGEPDADFDALMAEMGQLQDEIDAANGWDLEQTMEALKDQIVAYHLHNNDGVHDSHQRIFHGTLDFPLFLSDYQRLTPNADLVLEYSPNVADDESGIQEDISWLLEQIRR